jgi:hypothetical protein
MSKKKYGNLKSNIDHLISNQNWNQFKELFLRSVNQKSFTTTMISHRNAMRKIPIWLFHELACHYKLKIGQVMILLASCKQSGYTTLHTLIERCSSGTCYFSHAGGSLRKEFIGEPLEMILDPLFKASPEEVATFVALYDKIPEGKKLEKSPADLISDLTDREGAKCITKLAQLCLTPAIKLDEYKEILKSIEKSKIPKGWGPVFKVLNNYAIQRARLNTPYRSVKRITVLPSRPIEMSRKPDDLRKALRLSVA